LKHGRSLSARIFALSWFAVFAAFSPLISQAQSEAHPGAPTGAEVLVPPIRVEGSAADALFYDPVVPTTEGKIDQSSPGGSIISELSDELPVPINERGYPGTTSEFRGLGRTVEDTNVETLGVPLNLPQGGGFDFSTFPQFFWSSYQFRLGPGGTAFDPRASTGVLALKPWTAAALDSQSNGARVTALGGRYIGQVSVAAHEGNIAALVGGTFGFSDGTTGSISIKLPSWGKLDWRLHLLATRIDTPVPGSISFPTPEDSQVSARLIPVLEGSLDLGDGTFLKSSLFFDRSWINYRDPDYGSASRSDQYGLENVLIDGVWTIAATAKQAVLSGGSLVAPTESSANLRAGPTLHWGSVTADGFMSGDYVSGTGWEPEATVGLRDDLTEQLAVYTRESYAYRFPTLTDRYSAYYSPFGNSLPNPSLEPEQVMTALAGAEFHVKTVRVGIEGQAQFRNNAQLYITDPVTGNSQTENSGHASEVSLIPTLNWQLHPMLDLFQSVRFSGSTVTNFQQKIPYDPFVTYVMEARAHAAGDRPRWAATLGFRGVTSSVSDYYGDNLPGYGLVHLDAQYALLGRELGESGSLALQGRVENLLNRKVQVYSGYPLPGTVFAVGVVGTI
jgi:hypothetical protein